MAGSSWSTTRRTCRPSPLTTQNALYVWPTDGFVVASIGPDGLAGMAATLSGEPGLRGSAFYDLLAGAYADGVEWLVAADLRTLIDRAELDDTGLGFEDAKYLMVRWSESGDHPSGRAVLAFDGPRHGVASWLAAPAPMGSLEFVTADAAAAAAFVVRDPAELVDEMMAIMLRRDPDALEKLEQAEQEQGFDLREDLAAPLGGEFAFALDGPLAPKPSFKVVVEVYDPARLQTTLEWAVEHLNAELAEHQESSGSFALTSEEIGGRTDLVAGQLHRGGRGDRRLLHLRRLLPGGGAEPGAARHGDPRAPDRRQPARLGEVPRAAAGRRLHQLLGRPLPGPGIAPGAAGRHDRQGPGLRP